LFGLLRWLRNRTLRSALTNVVLGERMAARVEDQGVARSRITVIPNWADGRAIVPVAPDQNPLQQEWGLSDAFVVGYSGNLGRAHEIETLLEAANLIESGQHEQVDAIDPGNQSDHKPVHWLFIGSGAQTDRLKQLVDDRGLRSFSFKPYQPRDQLAQSLSVADVHLVSLRPALEGLIVPSKYYGIAAVGRPAIFIGDRDGEIARILDSCDGGIAVDEGDAETLAATITNLAREPRRAQRMGRNARVYFDEHFDVECAIAKWQDVLERAGVSGSSTRSIGEHDRTAKGEREGA
jgi:glycosyltransferase involved in cell wall biosynthesis